MGYEDVEKTEKGGHQAMKVIISALKDGKELIVEDAGYMLDRKPLISVAIRDAGSELQMYAVGKELRYGLGALLKMVVDFEEE